MTVLRIQNPLAYALPEVEALVHRAFDAQPSLAAPAVALEELRRLAALPYLVVLMMREGERWTGMVIATLPMTRLQQTATVYHLYTETSTARGELSRELVSLLDDLGLQAFETVNLNGAQDKAFERLFRQYAKITKRGTLFRFDLGGT